MWDWFEHYWSSVGLGAAVALILMLRYTNAFRSHVSISRWRDPVWLAWLTVVAYLLHNFEEYGIDAKGRAFHFPVAVCTQFGFDSVNNCPLVPAATLTARAAALPQPHPASSRRIPAAAGSAAQPWAQQWPPLLQSSAGLPRIDNPQWARNLIASGEGNMTRGGKHYAITNPRHIGDEGIRLLPKPVASTVRGIGVHRFLQFDATPSPGQ